MGPVRCPHGRRTGPAWESLMFFISYWTCTGPVRDPQGCRTASLRRRMGIDTTRICVITVRASYVRVDPLRFPCGQFTGRLRSLSPYGGRKLTMHTLKHYGPPIGRQNSYGAARDPYGPREWTYDLCSEQPGIIHYSVSLWYVLLSCLGITYFETIVTLIGRWLGTHVGARG